MAWAPYDYQFLKWFVIFSKQSGPALCNPAESLIMQTL